MIHRIEMNVSLKLNKTIKVYLINLTITLDYSLLINTQKY